MSSFSRRPMMAAGLLFLGFLSAAFLVSKYTAAAPPTDERWKKVEQAEQKGLPKTAIEELEPIITTCIEKKNYPEAIKAIVKKFALEGNIEGNKAEEKVKRLNAELAKSPKEMAPVFEAILGEWYWHYFQQNRWRFHNRSATAAAPSDDFTTWDLPRIYSEIDSHFTKSLEADKLLKETPIESYEVLLPKGTIPDNYRPTLYDFLAHEALRFYASPEQVGAKREDEWEISSTSPALAPVNEFLEWEPKTTHADSQKLKAVNLLKKLLAFHKNDEDKTAFLDAELHRLEIMHALAVGSEKEDKYKAALKSFYEENGKHELSALARARYARIIDADGERVEARKIALKGVQDFPKSRGGAECHNLIVDIEAKEVSLVTERVWNEPKPAFAVAYRNITRVHVRGYKLDWRKQLEQMKQGRHHSPEQINDDERKALLKTDSTFDFSDDLPATDDYKTRKRDVAIPGNLKPGFYVLFASESKDFSESASPIYQTFVWVSDLAVVVRSNNASGKIEGFVMKAESGDPISGAKLSVWTRHWDRGTMRIQKQAEVETNADGVFKIDGGNGKETFILASHKGHELAAAHGLHNYNSGEPNLAVMTQAVHFTDRSLYRPGQTIRFKGILYRADQKHDKYEVVPNKKVSVQLLDANHQKVQELELKANDYGSFDGSFTAPRDRLTGMFMITTTVGAMQAGNSWINVEEYKRPKFLTTIDAPKEPAKLKSDVTVVGRSIGYTGMPISSAKVAWRVARQVRYPYWFHICCFWRMPPHHSEAQEIAHGTTTTEADGSFKITFNAKPDATAKEADEPQFHYSVMADVTDTTGETRSGERSVTVGYTALQASISTEPWVTTETDVKLTIRTSSPDGEPRSAKGTLKIFNVRQPAKVIRSRMLDGHFEQFHHRRGLHVDHNTATPSLDPANPIGWEDGDKVSEHPFETDGKGVKELNVKLGAGLFRARLETEDAFGKPVKGMHQWTVLDPAAKKFPVKIPNEISASAWQIEPGKEFSALWGTGYDTGRAYVEVEHRGKVIKSYWTEKGRTQEAVTVPVKEEMRGGFTVHFTYVRENRAYLESRPVNVPWTNKQFTVKWDRFVNKLEPGQKEKWTAIITGPDAKRAAAEMVATLYDASLDAFKPHYWLGLSVFRHDYAYRYAQFLNQAAPLQQVTNWHSRDYWGVNGQYRTFSPDVMANLTGFMWGFGRADGPGGGMRLMKGAPAAGAVAEMDSGLAAPAAPAKNEMAKDKLAESKEDLRRAENHTNKPTESTAVSTARNLDKVAARKNLEETAFFFPKLSCDESGVVRMEFTMPEALTKWKFMGFAHDKELRSGMLTDEVVTAKELMIQPNPPRFLREGDLLEFTVKVANKSSGGLRGTVRLTLADARTGKPVDEAFGLTTTDQTFDIGANESKTFSWKLNVPDSATPITYKAVAATDRYSDGEEGGLPVLSKRILVTESLPLPIRGKQTKNFDFAKLRNSGNSDTLKHQSLTVQVTSNPTWYAVMALPYLMESKHESVDESFNRLYANALAHHIAKSDPKIRKVFDQWKGTPALDSPLEKNQELKSAILNETPWVIDAQKESQARKNVGVLFDENRLNDELAQIGKKMTEMQNNSGAWPWFPGGRDNPYITLYIAVGYGRLRHLGVNIDAAPAVKAIHVVDEWMADRWRHIVKHSDPSKNHLDSTAAFYLYGRSFFVEDKPVGKEHDESFKFWEGQARKYWLQLANRQGQAHIALALKRLGDKETPTAIVASLKERSKNEEEMGMYWRDLELSWWWFHAPIETQAVMIEVMDEVANDAKAVEDCKVWLLKQKQTQNWKTTKATADAVYALLLRGAGMLASDALVDVTLGDEKIKPENVEAGTGFYEQKFVKGEIKPEFGAIKLEKSDDGVSWGAVHWQYLEDISKVKPHEGTPLKLEKKLFKRIATPAGPKIEPVEGAVEPGDELVVRVVLRTDRDMEYVHLKDHRGSGTEPTNVLSRYKFQDGLAYYESTKDTASHFYIDYLPKGTYVFEYSVRVQHRGKYPTGLANIQCLYAPEFNSHSESIMLEVK